jgi:hypothetical protein
MYNSNKRQNNILEKFRIKAHLRSYLKDPIIIDKTLMDEAIAKLRDLPYESKDPAETIATELTLEAYRLGYFRYDDLTDAGCEIARKRKYRGHQKLTIQRDFNRQTNRNCYLLKTM